MSGAQLIMLASVVALGGASCGGAAECRPGRACELRGYEYVANELWAFRGCGSSEFAAVNIKGNEPGIEKLNAAIAELAIAAGCPAGSVVGGSDCQVHVSPYVELTGSLSAPTDIGVPCPAPCERWLTMLDIRMASASAPADCAKAALDFR